MDDGRARGFSLMLRQMLKAVEKRQANSTPPPAS
jgi:hypothetical protein